MLTVQDLQFHPAVKQERKTAHDFVLGGQHVELSGSLLSRLADEYLSFANGRSNDMALFRAMQCLDAAAEKGVEGATEQRIDLELAMGMA